MAALTTIGVYGFDAITFIESLQRAGVRVLLDVRQRRGVRGSQYAWANSLRLQALLADASIRYEHHRDLSPTTALRHLQYAEDARQGVGKRSRVQLAPSYIRGYTAQILDQADLGRIATALPEGGAAAMLCVERDPSACHRSLIARRLTEEYRVPVHHILPDGG
ncbi:MULTISPECIES: DUF488 domain-containing protein [Dermacoccus]|uniref:DUF488 domain-containing protein n=2 Tax=Dermacoccus TaxID=57495 RepID=A0A417Z223_9MICO|nr:DUF488 domain-containing protein [Dermacoccus abyssi]RHW44025.1 DUF488 domain-containing protein [Dermacoccus abyssi]